MGPSPSTNREGMDRFAKNFDGRVLSLVKRAFRYVVMGTINMIHLRGDVDFIAGKVVARTCELAFIILGDTVRLVIYVREQAVQDNCMFKAVASLDPSQASERCMEKLTIR